MYGQVPSQWWKMARKSFIVTVVFTKCVISKVYWHLIIICIFSCENINVSNKIKIVKWNRIKETMFTNEISNDTSKNIFGSSLQILFYILLLITFIFILFLSTYYYFNKYYYFISFPFHGILFNYAHLYSFKNIWLLPLYICYILVF